MKREIIKFLVLAMLAIGGGPAGAAIWNWSLTASSNATADPSINWAEGMAPSAVNDSARAMMAVTAAWRNDISGVNTTTGTATAYALATSEGVNTTPATGQMLAFFAHATNGIAPTLTVDGGTSFPIQFNGAAAPAGTIVVGTPYRISFTGTVWALEAGYGNPYGVPLGGLMSSTLTTAPNSNFILPAGQCISTTTYAAYWVALGSPASGSCSGGQFRVIDMRGRVPAALDNLNGSAANIMTNSINGCGVAFTTVGVICGNESQTLAATQVPSITSTASVSAPSSQFIPILNGGASSTQIATGSSGAFAPTNSGSMAFPTGLSGTATSNNTGGGAHPIVQPSIAVTYLLRVI